MIEIICEYLVKASCRGQFELAYGPGGAWSTLFSACEGYRGTTVLRDDRDPRRYLAIDIWDTLEQRDRAMAERASEYADLAADFAEWTAVIKDLGVYRVLSQATVRPRGSARTSGTRWRRGQR
jgi:hypothetical protein